MSAPESPLHVVADPTCDGARHDEVLTRVGQMTRSLHENLRGLGFDKLIERAAQDIPNARDRLDYVARMTEQAAQRVLDATDSATPLQQQIECGAEVLRREWQSALDAPFSEQAYREQVARTLTYLEQTQSGTASTRAHLMDIMMAQDFQDLTGQVIKKVTELAHGLEQQLVQLLLDFAPPEIKRDGGSGLLNGPQIHAIGAADVMTDQSQVDDLLGSLGF